MDHVIAVSACLLGYNCKYNGGNNLNPKLVKLLQGKKIIPICPEQLGGLSTPRIPSEIMSDGETVYDKAGHDTTLFFERGKQATYMILEQNNCHQVILKDGSPSCGYKTIYDGTFTGRKIPGEGITCKYLKEKGIEILEVTEEGEL